MRTVWALMAIMLVTFMAIAQPELAPATVRYNVGPLPESYPQSSPKAALTSVITAIERKKFDYLAAQLIEPSFIDGKVKERAQLYEDEADRDLRAERDARRAGPIENRISNDPTVFAELVKSEAQLRGFRAVVESIRNTIKENPDHLRELRRFRTDGQYVIVGETATVSVPEIKDRQVYLKRIGIRWLIEDRQKLETVPVEKK